MLTTQIEDAFDRLITYDFHLRNNDPLSQDFYKIAQGNVLCD